MGISLGPSANIPCKGRNPFGCLLGVYLGQPEEATLRRKASDLIKIILVIGFVWGCLEVLNPNSPSILVGFMGLKSYFLYAPVAFVLPYAIQIT